MLRPLLRKEFKMSSSNFLKTIALVLVTSLVGCASVNSVSLTPIPANRDHKVSASAQRWIILGFNFDNDFIDPLVDDLKQQCPQGVVSGILTKDETYSYLLVFKKQVNVTGYCYRRVAMETTPTPGKKSVQRGTR